MWTPSGKVTYGKPASATEEPKEPKVVGKSIPVVFKDSKDVIVIGTQMTTLLDAVKDWGGEPRWGKLNMG